MDPSNTSKYFGRFFFVAGMFFISVFRVRCRFDAPITTLLSPQVCVGKILPIHGIPDFVNKLREIREQCLVSPLDRLFVSMTACSSSAVDHCFVGLRSLDSRFVARPFRVSSRAFGAQERFVQESYRRVDACNRAHFYLWVSNRCVTVLCAAPSQTVGVVVRLLAAADTQNFGCMQDGG